MASYTCILYNTLQCNVPVSQLVVNGMQTSATDHLGMPKLDAATITTAIGVDTTVESSLSDATTITVPVYRRTWAESDHLAVTKEIVTARMRLHMQVRQVCLQLTQSSVSWQRYYYCHSLMTSLPTRGHSAKDTATSHPIVEIRYECNMITALQPTGESESIVVLESGVPSITQFFASDRDGALVRGPRHRHGCRT
jgi:hypothetical protein